LIEGSTNAEALAEAFVQGAVVDWHSWAGGEKYHRVALPGYPFQRERYWVEPSQKKVQAAGKATGRGLLGNRLQVAGLRAVFETQLSVDGATGWIGDHVLDGRAVFPLTGYAELMLEAGEEIFGCVAALEDLVLLAPLVINQACMVQVVAEFESQGRSRVRAYAAGNGEEWQKVAEAWLRPAEISGTLERVDLDAIQRHLDEKDSVAFYANIRKSGATFGPRFQGIARLWSGTDEALGEVNVRAAEEGFIFAPWRLDACLQLIGTVRGDEDLYLPASVGEIHVYGAPGHQSCWSHLRSRRMDPSTLAVDVTITHPDGTLLAVFRDIVFRKSDARQKSIPSWFYRIRWEQAETPAPAKEKLRRIAMLGSSPRMQETAAYLREQGIDVIAETTAHSNTASLFRDLDAVLCFAPPEASEEPRPGRLVADMKERVQLVLESAQELLRNMGEEKPRLYVISESACVVQTQADETIDLLNSPLAGMASGIALEVPELQCTLIDAAGQENGIIARQIAREVLAGTDDLRVAFRSERRYTPRLERVSSSALPPSDGEAKALSQGTGIEGLKYETVKRQQLKADEVEIEVRATALNFRDVLKATGLLEHAGPIGADCSGVIARVGSGISDMRVGDRVVAIAPGCFASHVVTAADLVVQKPEELSFENAAAQTIAYLTVDYCLHEMARIRRGDRVLIHAAAGGVGLAAVHLCKRAGAEVFATAGNEEKRAWLRNLGIEHVFDSRSLDFKDQITGGVDVVLNSLAGGAVEAGLSLLRPGGRFIELGKTDLRQTDEIARNWPGISYRQADLTPLIAARSPWLREHMSALLNEIAAGSLPMLPLTIFEQRETKQAFRYMAGARHIGRIVIRSAKRELAGGTHLITGGMRGLGLRLAEWLVERGARDLLLTGRNPASEESSRTIAKLEAKGARVRIHCGDVAEIETVRELTAQSGDALRGVWHCAGVTHDALLEEQNWATCAEALSAKAEGAWNLHLATREAKPEFFVMFSSWASLAGSRGQVNYCAANAFLDALATARSSEGLSALSVNWGAWGETGMATSEAVQRHLARSGMEIMRPEHGFLALEAALYTREPLLAIAPIDWPKYLSQLTGSQHSFYADLIRDSSGSGSSAGTVPGSDGSAAARGGTAAPNGELSAILTGPIAGRASAIQRVVEGVLRRTLDLPSSEEIDPDKAFSDLGMDSLLAVELRNNLSTFLQRRLPSTLVFDYPTPQKMVRFIEQELFPALSTEPASENALPSGSEVAEIATPLNILDEIEGLSDEEVDSIFENRAGR
jgi:NADPH:quinone reductase-like Zn-dependent oxidoreductase/short-subunit dehydrogenase/acyl carrier protein